MLDGREGHCEKESDESMLCSSTNIKELLDAFVKSKEHKGVYWTLLSYFGPEGEDFLHQAYAEICEKPESAKKGLKKGHPLVAIITRKAISIGRNSTKRNRKIALHDNLPSQEIPALQEEIAQCRDILSKAKASPEDLALFYEKYAEGETFVGLAKKANKSVGFIQGRIKKTLQALRSAVLSTFALLFRSKQAHALYKVIAILLISCGLNAVLTVVFCKSIFPTQTSHSKKKPKNSSSPRKETSFPPTGNRSKDRKNEEKAKMGSANSSSRKGNKSRKGKRISPLSSDKRPEKRKVLKVLLIQKKKEAKPAVILSKSRKTKKKVAEKTPRASEPIVSRGFPPIGCHEEGARAVHSSQALMRICTNSKLAPGYKVIVLEPKLNHGSVRIFHTRAYKAAQRGVWSANSPAMRKLSGHIAKFAYKKKKRVTAYKLIRASKKQILAYYRIQ